MSTETQRRINRITALAQGVLKELDDLRKSLVKKRPIPGFPGYHATDEGNILSKKGFVLSTWLRDKKHGDRNHEKVKIYRNGIGVNCYVHELVALAFLGERPDGYDLHHIDFNMHNNRPENLRYMPHAEHVALHAAQRTA